jgi:bacillopeptidase F (M6 metalloprotease family)
MSWKTTWKNEKLTKKHFIIVVMMKKTRKIKKFAKKALNRIIIEWDLNAKDCFRDLSIHQFKLIKKIVMNKIKFEKAKLKMNQIIIIKLRNLEREVFKSCISQFLDWEKVYKKISLTLFVKSCILDEIRLENHWRKNRFTYRKDDDHFCKINKFKFENAFSHRH